MSQVAPHPRPNPTDIKTRESISRISQSASSSNTECHYCHGKGHIAARHPCHTLTIEPECEETIPENALEDFNPLKSANSEEQNEEEYEDAVNHVNIMRYIVTTPADSEAWKRISIFHIYAHVGVRSINLSLMMEVL